VLLDAPDAVSVPPVCGSCTAVTLSLCSAEWMLLGSGAYCACQCKNQQVCCVLHVPAGFELTGSELADWMVKLQDFGNCHNINFVTPEHVAPQVVCAYHSIVRTSVFGTRTCCISRGNVQLHRCCDEKLVRHKLLLRQIQAADAGLKAPGVVHDLGKAWHSERGSVS
jgi:hypothetical protein